MQFEKGFLQLLLLVYTQLQSPVARMCVRVQLQEYTFVPCSLANVYTNSKDFIKSNQLGPCYQSISAIILARVTASVCFACMYLLERMEIFRQPLISAL